MLFNRVEVPDQYTALSRMPLPTATEQLVWTTNIFISADLTEVRRPLSASPAITITYNFILNCNSRQLLQSAVSDNNTWLIPYFPHHTRGANINGVAIPATINNRPYPYKDYWLCWNSSTFVYRAIDNLMLADPTTTNEDYEKVINSPAFWIAPCYTAVIDPSIGYADVGQFRDGSTIALKFRLTGDSETALVYQTDSFDFPNSVKSPVQVEYIRNEATFMPPPAGIDTYRPHALMANSTPIINATYWLDYNDFQRDDYDFRGVFFKGQGANTAGHYYNNQTLHRLQDDIVNINYDRGLSQATLKLREVTA